MSLHWWKCPQQIQLWSRILNCNSISTVASFKLPNTVLPPVTVKCDVSSVTRTKYCINGQDNYDHPITRGRVGSQPLVPFVFPRRFDHELVLCKATDLVSSSGPDETNKKENPKGKPSKEQVEVVYLRLSEDIPRLFTGPQDYSIYDPQMIFEDNIRNKIVIGLQNYVVNISFMKIKSHIKYTHVKMNVLRATQHPEEGCVKIRWRIVGAPGYFKMITRFWKFKPVSIFRTKTVSDGNAEWIDGFSIFHINDQGKISRHICEKMMPDDDKVVDGKKSKINVAI